jgi:hypothetical protein
MIDNTVKFVRYTVEKYIWGVGHSIGVFGCIARGGRGTGRKWCLARVDFIEKFLLPNITALGFSDTEIIAQIELEICCISRRCRKICIYAGDKSFASLRLAATRLNKQGNCIPRVYSLL